MQDYVQYGSLKFYAKLKHYSLIWGIISNLKKPSSNLSFLQHQSKQVARKTEVCQVS